MDWFPIVFIAFKVIVLGTGMFLAIKWHHDQGKKHRDKTGGPHAPAEHIPLGNAEGAPLQSVEPVASKAHEREAGRSRPAS
ncbi:hypothetical protein AVHY2522_12510 [Acidovorax sp. SUPP2522]|uniref:hypothetical protein n=1 Tax=unclassified Acidovorax TaxID=2684926 RepID=UPI002349E61C|nr:MULTISPECIES: hypothetical protein [unclassified Acidovorax]WCM98853.1 hypothetical protein M5C96_05200 [Acidovorax sp. GBBC 1281]GKT16667.1 hypothetical protein AVHY2522_12510 [Acidovorax sp. SUPP2522]